MWTLPFSLKLYQHAQARGGNRLWGYVWREGLCRFAILALIFLAIIALSSAHTWMHWIQYGLLAVAAAVCSFLPPVFLFRDFSKKEAE